MEIENDRERLTKLETYLDLGYGQACLRRPAVARLVENAWLFFHRERYELCARVVMPHHVHALVKVGEVAMARIVESWKSYTPDAANKRLLRQGRFWQPGYWDAYMRDARHESKAVRCIKCNPVKAKLVRDSADWRWSSARFRDDFGRLVLPPRRGSCRAAAGSRWGRREAPQELQI